MALTVHTLYAVNIATTAAVDLFIDQITDFNVDTGINEMLVTADGSVDPTYVAIQNQSPRINFTTSALATVLATCGISGLKIDSDVDDDGAEFWFQKMAEGGVRATGSNHMKLTMNEGMLLPRVISASNDGGPATMTMEMVITWDGTNDPLVIATSQALEGTAIVGEVFVPGIVMINGTQLDGIQDISIDFGLTEMVVTADGNVWPTFTAIQTRKPVITITTLDVIALNTFGLTGDAQGATDSIVYLRKVDEGGTRVADGTSEHISFTIDDGMITVKTIGGGDEPQQSEVQITPTYDGSNAIMLIDTTAAIV
jgi:hypothetical protein